jgi:hypothetical protein
MACQVIPAPLPTIIHCPSMPAWCTLKEEPQFWFRPTRADAVDVSFNHGDAVSSGLGYAELERCSVQTHKASRRRVIPSWALNPATLQTVLVAFWEATRTIGSFFARQVKARSAQA